MNLQGKVAVVTGAAQRVGKAIALALAAEGAHIVLHYHRSEQAARQTQAEIAALGVEVTSVQADLSQPDSVAPVIDATRETFGRLDVLVNSAATFQKRDFLDVSLKDWDYLMAVNLRAPFLLSQQAARLMQTGDGGLIVNISDLIGLRPRRTYPHHSVAKAALISLTQVMALALGPDIRVNAVAPGLILPPDTLPAAKWETYGAALPLERTGATRNVQQAVLALVANDFINGQTLVVDGGESLVGPSDY